MGLKYVATGFKPTMQLRKPKLAATLQTLNKLTWANTFHSVFSFPENHSTLKPILGMKRFLSSLFKPQTQPQMCAPCQLKKCHQQ